METIHDQVAILQAVLADYALPVRGRHGIAHWARVLETGLRIVQANNGDKEVVTMFAIFHDSRRVNEDRDRGHGLRGAEYARSLRGRLLHLSDAQFERFHEACEFHTRGRTSNEPTVAACWDADRLDLGRVGIKPDPKRLSTVVGRELISWANERAVGDYQPETLAVWGY